MPNNSSKPAWQTAMEMLERRPKGTRLALLAYWEQKAKETADLEALRVTREVRRRLAEEMDEERSPLSPEATRNSC